MGKYYVYRHIRPDKNEVFYVGFGTKSDTYTTYRSEYKRVFVKAKRQRSAMWRRIFLKNNRQIIVEILFESDCVTCAKAKETEFILLYGRRDLGTGTLVNLTDGGEKNTGRIVSKETRKRMSENNWSKNFGRGEASNRHKKVWLYTLNGDLVEIVSGMRECCRKYNLNSSCLSKLKAGVCVQCKGLRLFDSDQGEKIEPLTIYGDDLLKTPVKQITSDGVVLATYPGMVDAGRAMSVTVYAISRAVRKNKKCKGFFWQKV